MRASLPALALLSALAAAAHSASGDVPLLARGDRRLVLPSVRAVRPPADRQALRAPLPAQPFGGLAAARVALRGVPTTPPLVLEDGGVAVGLASPPSLVWVARDGTVRATAALDDRPTGELVLGGDGRVWVTCENRVVYGVAPNASGPIAIAAPSPTPAGAVVRPDGTLLLLSNYSSAGVELSLFSPAGEPIATRMLPGRLLLPNTAVDARCVWLSLTTGVACITSGGDVQDLSFARGASRFARLEGDRIALVTGNTLELRSLAGVLYARLDMGGSAPGAAPIAGPSVLNLLPMPNGGLALLHGGSPQELWLVSREGAVTARIPVASGRLEDVLMDPTGAVLVVEGDGELNAYEPDGTPRWTLPLRDPPARRTAPLPGGGLALASSSGNLLFLH